MGKCLCYKNGCINNKDGLCQKYRSKDDGLGIHCSGYWTEEKIDHFKYYAEMFSTGMKNSWKNNLYYIDLFAGPGKCIIREDQKEINGACLEVVFLKDKFKKYFFVDKNNSCVNALKKRLQGFTNVEYYNEDCNIAIKKIIQDIPDSSLSLAIIDPDSLQFHFDSYIELAKRRIDLIVNYPVAPILRAVHSVLKKKTNSKVLDDFYPDWRAVVERKSQQMIARDLVKGYVDKIEKLDYYSNLSKVPFRNIKNTTLYYLVYFSKDKKGIEFWDKKTAAFKRKNPQQSLF